jgi:hypothetical protein
VEFDLTPAFMLVSCSVYYTLRMDAACSSETSVDFQQTARRYVPEDNTPPVLLLSSGSLFLVRIHQTT